MENTIQVFENVVSGTEPMVELRSWVDSVRSLYVRPQMSGLLKMSQSDREKALQAYLDWETREHELLDTLRRAHNVATENHDDAPDLTLKALLAGEEMELEQAQEEAGISGGG